MPANVAGFGLFAAKWWEVVEGRMVDRMESVGIWIPASATFKPKRHSFGGPGPWSGHLAFAYDLVAAEKPRVLVELGTFYGESYFSFCQAMQERSVACACYAVDTWQGDDHGGLYGEEIYSDVDAYNRANYESFSHLMRMT